MKRILTIVLAVSTCLGAYATGPDSSKVKLSTTQITYIAEPEEWSNPITTTLEDEQALGVLKQRLAKIWSKHSKQWSKDKEESEDWY